MHSANIKVIGFSLLKKSFKCNTLLEDVMHCTIHAATMVSLLLKLSYFIDSTPNRPFFKMAAENSNKLKLAKIKKVYQH